MGLKEQRERKNKCVVTQELDEKKRKEKEKYTRITSKKRRVTYTNDEKRENSKVKEYEKLGEIK